jgi:hypothetical protein
MILGAAMMKAAWLHHDVIMPHATRPRIARALAVLRGKTVEMAPRSTIICRCDI